MVHFTDRVHSIVDKVHSASRYCAFHISCPCWLIESLHCSGLLCKLIGCEVVKVALSLFKHFQKTDVKSTIAMYSDQKKNP
jgi:hypothetical protein